jgi:hypothetical protein
MQKQRKIKYKIAESKQILQRLNKYFLKVIQLLQNKKLQKQNTNTKLQKLKRKRNTRFAETE